MYPYARHQCTAGCIQVLKGTTQYSEAEVNALESLTDMAIDFIEQCGKRAALWQENAKRNQGNFFDAQMAIPYTLDEIEPDSTLNLSPPSTVTFPTQPVPYVSALHGVAVPARDPDVPLFFPRFPPPPLKRRHPVPVAELRHTRSRACVKELQERNPQPIAKPIILTQEEIDQYAERPRKQLYVQRGEAMYDEEAEAILRGE